MFFNMATLTLTHDLDIIFVHHHTKFGGPAVNSFGSINFFLVTFFLVNGKITFFNMVTLTFKHNLDMVHLHHRKKLGDHRSNGS